MRKIYKFICCWWETTNKKSIKQKNISWSKVYICPKCWYYNSKILEKEKITFIL